MDEKQAKALRAPFKPEQVGKLPKPTKRENPKGKCNECGGWHGLPAVHLDYVGHAAVTDRFLQVDPTWTWAPMATDSNGFPLLDNKGGLWINLTLCGVTRPGYGDEGNGKGMKEIIGDALRNAGMRFGVGLDLWSKEDLHASDDETESVTRTAAQKQAQSGGDGKGAAAASEVTAAAADPVAGALHTRILELAAELGANRVAVQKSITDNQGKATAAAHFSWCERQIKTMEASVQVKKAEAESPFQPPESAKADA